MDAIVFVKKTLSIACFVILFLTSCYPMPRFPTCPMGSAHEYLSCALEVENDPASEEEFEHISKSVSAYCEEDTSEWLPILDTNAKKSALELQLYIRDKIESGELGDDDIELDNESIFHGVVTLYILRPALAGVWGNTGSCITAFEELEGGALMGWIEEQEKN